jgi:hypothetical protein
MAVRSRAAQILDECGDLDYNTDSPFVGPFSIPASSTIAHYGDFEVRGEAILPLMSQAPEYCPPGSADEAFQVFKEWIGWTGEPSVRPAAPAAATRKTVVINDLHIPNQDEDSIRQLIENEAADTDELVIAGDFATMFNWSRFPKFRQTHTPKEEIISATKVLRLLSEAFTKVTLFGGNHDARFVKWMVGDKAMTPEMLDALEFMNPGFSSPLKFMAKGLPNVEVLDAIKCEGADFSFFYQFGDFVACHAETYSIIPNRATGNACKWLKSFAEPMGLVKPFRVVGQAHTHQQGKVFGDYATWLFELGCMCGIEDYVGAGKILTPRPWVKGYTVVRQDAVTGRTDINNSHFVHTGKF